MVMVHSFSGKGDTGSPNSGGDLRTIGGSATTICDDSLLLKTLKMSDNMIFHKLIVVSIIHMK